MVNTLKISVNDSKCMVAMATAPEWHRDYGQLNRDSSKTIKTPLKKMLKDYIDKVEQ